VLTDIVQAEQRRKDQVITVEYDDQAASDQVPTPRTGSDDTAADRAAPSGPA
jgi:hypothetical protein